MYLDSIGIDFDTRCTMLQLGIGLLAISSDDVVQILNFLADKVTLGWFWLKSSWD